VRCTSKKEDDSHYIRLLVNLERVNNIRWVNRYFLEAHKIILPGGYFAGRVRTVDLYSKKFFEKYPKYFSQVLYFVDFVFRRIFPQASGDEENLFHADEG